MADDKELDTVLKLFDEKKTTAVFNAIDLALNDVITTVEPTPYDVEIALKLIDLKLKELEFRSASAGVDEEYTPSEETENSKAIYK